MELFGAIYRYWDMGPRWAPLFCTLMVPFFIWLKPGAVNQIFGRGVESTKVLTIAGMFDSLPSQYGPYLLSLSNQSKFRLACDVKEQKAACLNGLAYRGYPVAVEYYPFKPG